MSPSVEIKIQIKGKKLFVVQWRDKVPFSMCFCGHLQLGSCAGGVSNTASLHSPSSHGHVPCCDASGVPKTSSYSCCAPVAMQYLPYGASSMTTHIKMWLGAKVDKTVRTSVFPSKGFAVNKFQYET